MSYQFATSRDGNVVSSSGLAQETLSTGENILAEQVWLGGSLLDIRSKTKVLQGVTGECTLEDIPLWNQDGSSTGQASGDDSEVLLVPRRLYKDPFRVGHHVLVLCDTWKGSDPNAPTITNFREACAKIMDKAKASQPWFGIEQEQTLMDCSSSATWPLGWPRGGQPSPQGPFQTGVGAELSFGRAIANAHMRVCLQAGVKMSGLNAEVMPGQWEFQVGPCEGIQMGDDLWMARYLLLRVAEDHSVAVSFDPKPVKGDWNGAGCHTNYSTVATRNDGGFTAIKQQLAKMGKYHTKHVMVQGTKNNERMTGLHETSSLDNFSWGVANRGCSCRVPRETERCNKGYLEDRRPASNCDPQLVTACLVDTTVLDGTEEYDALISRIKTDTPHLLLNIN